MRAVHDLLTQPVGPQVRRLALPVGIGFFFNTMFNVVDTWYAGRISTEAVAAVSLSFPLFFLIIAVASGISTGATALMGHAIGAGRRDEASVLAAQTISFGLIHGVLLTLAGWLAMPAIFRLLGAQGDYLALAVAYMGAMFSGAVFFVANQAHNSILNASGDTKSFRNFLILAFLLNLVYDPWFIYGGFGLPPLGLAGIAWGTVAIQALGTLYLHGRARRTGLLGQLGWPGYRPRLAVFRDLARQGLPASLTMLTVAVGVFVITWYVGRFGHAAMAAYGIGTRIEQIVLLPVMGLNVATLTMVAQNAGARLFDRVRATILTALGSGLTLMSGGTLLVFLLADHLMGLFTADREVVAIGAVYLRIAAFVFPAYVILYINSFALQGLQRPRFALLLGLFRQFVAPVPVFWLLAIFMGWGVSGVWWGILLINWLGTALSLLYVRRTLRELVAEVGRAG
ncbi:MAG TPA: MATE family efflux transporter [Geobacteraceae bacterium]|nr:MATE family efflux transporter [Geobacteraceae bacterium]